MKKTILLFSFITALFISACENKNSDSPSLPASEFKATINGIEWIADSVITVHILNYGPLPNSFEIQAYKKDGSSLLLETNSDTNSVTVLNVKLSKFTASINHPVSNAININWQTTEEDNLQNFVLEKSTDGNNFYDVATIPATNNKNGSSYSYDNKPTLNEIFVAENLIYYRLKMINMDNSFTYSSVVVINPSTAALYIFSSQDYSWGFNGNTTITSVDKNLKLITGSFNFKCVNDTTGKQFNVSNGSFKNLHYTE